MKPKVLISRCIELDHCRWNAQIISSKFVKSLKPYVEFITVCPEVELGLGIPRESIRLIRTEVEGEEILAHSLSGKDISQEMRALTIKLVADLPKVYGAILKAGSPSCGVKNVKVYPKAGKISAVHKKGTGYFAKEAMETLSFCAIEDEGRLTNQRIREHFLTKLFTFWNFDQLPLTMKAIGNFHADNKYLFMSYNQSALKVAGKLVANHDKRSIEEVYAEYRKSLSAIFSRVSSIGKNINVLQHMFGYYSKELSRKEVEYFGELLESYKLNRVSLITLISVLKSWALHYDLDYILRQTYLQPFPAELNSLIDSGKK